MRSECEGDGLRAEYKNFAAQKESKPNSSKKGAKHTHTMAS